MKLQVTKYPYPSKGAGAENLEIKLGNGKAIVVPPLIKMKWTHEQLEYLTRFVN